MHMNDTNLNGVDRIFESLNNHDLPKEAKRNEDSLIYFWRNWNWFRNNRKKKKQKKTEFKKKKNKKNQDVNLKKLNLLPASGDISSNLPIQIIFTTNVGNQGRNHQYEYYYS